MSAPAASGVSPASRLVVGLAGPRLETAERAWLEVHRPAGVVLFARNVRDAAQLAALCRDLRAALPPHAEIVADQEGGAVSVLAGAVGRPPAPWLLGALDDPGLTRAVHAETAARARACGVERLLAPCADVLAAEGSSVIGSRAFGADVDRVARHVASAVRGLRDGGVRCVLKHWPGHGAVAADTHVSSAGVPRAPDPAPFRAGIAAGADAIMVGHLAIGGVAPPATLDATAGAAARRLGASRLYADDVTMGALLRPLASLGVSFAGTGLLDPAALPRDWFDVLARGACDLWLCRGIPWTAFPVAGIAQPPASAMPERRPDAPASRSWRLARRKAASPWLTKGEGPLALWRCAPDHRWGGAGREAVRAGGWRGVLLDIAGPPPPAGTVRQLLVAGHASPDRPAVSAARRWLAGAAASEGRCLVLGHPALAAAAAVVLPARWRIVSGYDVRPVDLAAFLAS